MNRSDEVRDEWISEEKEFMEQIEATHSVSDNSDTADHRRDEFERLLKEYGYNHPERGQILDGVIEVVQEDTIILDVGLKRAAIVPSREVKNLREEVSDSLSLGDVVPIYVSRTPRGDENLLVSIEKGIEYQNWLEAEKLMEQAEAIKVQVTGQNKGGLLIRFAELNGFIPNSHIPELLHIHNHTDMQSQKREMRGEFIQVKPIEVDRKNNRLVFSILAAQEDLREQRLRELVVGERIVGMITNVVDFGVFVDLGGVEGLVHISELDWQRVENPAELFSPGDEIEVQIKSIDLERERISLSRKMLLPNPWDVIGEHFSPGDIISVEVVDQVDFGVFAQLENGIQGLIHVSELGYTKPDGVRSVVETGERIPVVILDIDSERERVALSMRQVPREKQIDWMMANVEDEPAA